MEGWRGGADEKQRENKRMRGRGGEWREWRVEDRTHTRNGESSLDRMILILIATHRFVFYDLVEPTAGEALTPLVGVVEPLPLVGAEPVVGVVVPEPVAAVVDGAAPLPLTELDRVFSIASISDFNTLYRS